MSSINGEAAVAALPSAMTKRASVVVDGRARDSRVDVERGDRGEGGVVASG